jgi:hypothetical protein
MAKGSSGGAASALTLGAKKSHARQSIRVALHANLLMLGMPPYVQSRVFSKTGRIREATRVLDNAEVTIGADGTVRRDLPNAAAAVKELIKQCVAQPGFVGALAVDGATFRHEHAVAIMLLSKQLPAPILLCLVYPEGDGPYTALREAADIKTVLTEYGLRLSNIACLMGDNVTFNAKLAKLLGLRLGKCLPHSFNLIVKAALKFFETVHTATATLSSILPAGGSSRHHKSLAAAGLNARKMTVYLNRFGTILSAVSYIVTNFDAVFQWIKENLPRKEAALTLASVQAMSDTENEDEDNEEEEAEATMSGDEDEATTSGDEDEAEADAPSDDDEEDEDEDSNDEAATDADEAAACVADAVMQLVGGSLIKTSIRDAYDHPFLLVELALVDRAFGALTELITDCSADGMDKLPAILGKIADFEVRTTSLRDPKTAKEYVELLVRGIVSGTVLPSHGPRRYSADVRAAIKAGATAHTPVLVEKLQRAATAAMMQYTKHVEPQVAELKRMRLFDVFVPVAQLPATPAGLFDDRCLSRLVVFLNCFLTKLYRCDPDCGRDYAVYLNDRRSADWQAPADSYRYWLGNIKRFRALAPLALKALEFPLSSISAERTFAMARAVDVPRRRSQKRATFEREVFLRANSAFTTNVLSSALDTYLAIK